MRLVYLVTGLLLGLSFGLELGAHFQSLYDCVIFCGPTP